MLRNSRQVQTTEDSSSIRVDRWRMLSATILFAIGMSIYSNSLRGVFLFDDIPNIVKSEVVKGPFLSSFQTSRPFTLASFCLNYHLGGMSPAGFHLFNNAVHSAATVSLYGLLVVVFSKTSLGLQKSDLLAFIAALIWCVHPLNTQAVTYVVQRAESMMGLCFFTFLFCIAKSATST